MDKADKDLVKKVVQIARDKARDDIAFFGANVSHSRVTDFVATDLWLKFNEEAEREENVPATRAPRRTLRL